MIVVNNGFVLLHDLLTGGVVRQVELVDQREDDFLVLGSHCLRGQFVEGGRQRVFLLEFTPLNPVLFDHEEAQVKDQARVGEDLFRDLELHSLLEGLLETVGDRN